MASAVADAAGSRQQSRRLPPRIVPAIPHRLARAIPAARPITPDESSKDTTPQHEPETDPHIAAQEVNAPRGEPQQTPLETPMTPDSKDSTTGKSEAGAAALADSPATSRDDNIDTTKSPEDTHHKIVANDTSSYPHISTSDHLSAPSRSRQPPIPVELPPAFYPSRHIESQPSHDIHTSGHGQAQQGRLSAGAVVFQASQDLIPLHGDPELEQAPTFRPPPGLAPPQHGHGPYSSEYHYQHKPSNGVSWDPYIQSMGSRDALQEATVAGDAFDNTAKPMPSKHDLFPMNDIVTPQPRSLHEPISTEGGIGSDRGTELQPMPYQNGAQPLTEHFEHSPFEIAAYLSSQFGNPEFADFLLQVRSNQATLLSIPVHGIVVSRSAAVAAAIRRNSTAFTKATELLRGIEVHAANPSVTSESLEEAIKVLYGGPLLSPHNFLFGLKPYVAGSLEIPPSSDIRKRMEQVLSYIAAAETLQMPSMQARGVEIARLILRWDTLDQVLQYALRALAPTHQATENAAASENVFIATLVTYAVEFMAYNFPVDFGLYTIAPELYQTPRLPSVEARQGAHNPRLSKIRFGEAPLEDDHQPNQVTRMLSSILLTVPSTLLERLLNHRATANRIGWTGIGRIMRSVVAEREDRRCKVLHNSTRQSASGTMPLAFTQNTHTEERVQQIEPSQVYPSGLRIVTTWVR